MMAITTSLPANCDTRESNDDMISSTSASCSKVERISSTPAKKASSPQHARTASRSAISS